MNNLPQMTDREFFDTLRRDVQAELDAYVYGVAPEAIGRPMSDDAVARGLSEMRGSLVDPHWLDVEIRDTFEQVQMQTAPSRRCAVIADDGKGMLLLFDPVEQEYALAQRTSTGFSTIGVRGDAVGCFLSR